MKALYVFISGPISSDPLRGTTAAVKVASRIMERGHYPFVPQLNCLWQMIQPQLYETWMAYDFAWIKKCDVLVRLPGESPGADREVAHAKEMGIPVFFSLDSFMASELWASS